MLTRYWQWTSPTASGNATSGLPFGPLRFRAWTNAVTAPPVDHGGGGRAYRIPVDNRLRDFALQRDDELLLLVAAAFVTLQ